MTETSPEKLIIFTRFPEPGTTKTRMIPALGAEGAASLQRAMTEQTLATARTCAEQQHISFAVLFAGGDEHLMREWLGSDIQCRAQNDGDLGNRMRHAALDAFDDGAERVAIIGTDCPGLTARHVRESFETLRENDLVIGPAHDGGYYLIGLSNRLGSAPLNALFNDIPWGGPDVLRKSLDRAEATGLSVHLLETLADVDTPDDLDILEGIDGFESIISPQKKLSVIIPALNESETIEATLSSIGKSNHIEVIVADGGSTDDTAQKASSLGARVVTSSPGRAHQMNAGAEHATGDLLLFLHADTVLPEGFESIIRQTLDGTGVVCGAFTLRFDSSHGFLRFVERTTAFRSRVMNMPYGDQALFMRKSVFRDIGGFPDQPIMEDFELVRRLGRTGRIVTVPETVITSSRRWQKRGFLRTTLLNQAIILGYYCGVSPETLYRWYYGK